MSSGPVGRSWPFHTAAVGLLGMMGGSLLQYSLSVASPVLISSVGMSEPQVGLVAATLMASATALVGFAGPIADAIGVRRAFNILFISAAMSLAILALAQTLAWVVVASLVGGIAVAAGNPVTNMLVAETPDRMQGLMVGIKQSGVMCAQILCGLAIPAVAFFSSWRWGVATLMLAPLIGFMLTTRIPQRSRRAIHWRGLGQGQTVRLGWLAAYSFFAACSMSTLATYLPTFAVGIVGFSFVGAGTIVTVMGLTGFVARLVWAHVASTLRRPGVLLSLLSGSGAMAMVLVACAAVGGSAYLWVGALVAGSLLAGFTSVVQIIVLRNAGPSEIGRVTSVVQQGFLGGLLAGPAGAGLILSLTADYSVVWGVAATAATVAALIALFCSPDVST